METVDLSIIPDKTSPVVYASQYDEGRVQRFMLYDGARPYTLSGDETIELRIRKPNNQTETIEIENSGDDYIDLTFTDQLTDTAGDVYCKFRIDDISTKGFYIKVEPGPARIYTGYADGEIVEFETDLVENLIILNVELSPSQDFNGYDSQWIGGAGKNLFDIDSAVPGYIVGNGKSINLPDRENLTSDFIPVVGGETYVYSSYPTITTERWTGWAFYTDKDMSTVTVGARYTNYNAVVSFKAPAEAKYVRIGSRYLSNGGYAQLEEGSSATDWVPYQNICPIEGTTLIKTSCTKKNLLNIDSYEWINNSNIIWGGSNTSISGNLVLPAGTYTLSCSHNVSGFYIDDENGSVHRAYNRMSTTFTIQSRRAISIKIYISGVTQADLLSYNYQLELGSAVTDYEAYTGSEIEVSLSKELCNAKAKLTTGKADITSRKVKISDLSWSYNSQYKFFNAIVNDIKKNADASKKLEGLSHEGYVNRTAQQAGSGNVNGSIAGLNNNIRIKDLRFEDVTSFVNAVGDYYILYPLESSYEDAVSTPASLPTLVGTNIVYSDSGPVEVAYHKSTPDGRR